MHPDLQTLVDAGTLPAAAARTLELLPPGTYCQHKSWGFGRVAAWNLGGNQILIDFGPRKGHAMQLVYAAEHLHPLPTDHFLVRRAEDLPGTKKIANEDPAALLALILRHIPGHRLPVTQILAMLTPVPFSEAEAKRWWENAKRALKKDGRFSVPAKKTESLEMRENAPDGTANVAGGSAAAERLLRQFPGARTIKDQLATLDAMLKEIESFRAAGDPAAPLIPVLTAVGQTALQSARLNATHALELLIVRDELAAAAGISLPEDAPTLAALLRGEEPRLAAVLDSLPAARQRAAVATLPAAFGPEGWPARACSILPLTRHARVVGEVAKLFEGENRLEDLARFFDHCLRDYSVSCEMLLWLCREHGDTKNSRTGGAENPFRALIDPRTFSAILSALERDRFSDVKRGTKLRELLIGDRTLAVNLLAGDPAERRSAARAFLATPILEEIDKRSLMARLIKAYPEVNTLLGGGNVEEPTGDIPLIVSWSSLAKRKEEYDHLVNKEIPKNSQEIGLAASYGDLRENFEFKAAKEQQSVLLRRRAEMDQDLARARGTNFENPDTAQVSIGTVVGLEDPTGGEVVETYTILGAWDGDPDRQIISYQTALGQALMGHRAGETITLPQEAGAPPRRLRIASIQAYVGALEPAGAVS